VFPEKLNYASLPEQRAYTVDIDECKEFLEGTLTGRLPARTNEMILAVGEGEPGDETGWHTHMPDVDQFVAPLSGQLRVTLEQPDETDQVVEVGPGEVLYLPGGARHTMEVVGEDWHRSLVILPSASVTTTSDLSADETAEQTDELSSDASSPVGLWVDRMRDELVVRDETAVSE